MSKKESVFWIVCGVALTAIVLYLAPRARGEEIRTLPNDENKWYVSVVGDANDAGYQKVLAWFDSGDLKDLKDQTHFNAVTIDSPMYPHYQVNGTKLPFVRVQTADGAVVYEAAGIKCRGAPRLFTVRSPRRRATTRRWCFGGDTASAAGT